MRLIDADELKLKLPNTYHNGFENCRECRLLEREEVNAYIDRMPTIDAIPIEPLAVWLAGYHVSPPEYALWETRAYDEIDPQGVAFTPNQIVIAWVYHLRKLMESGLMG